MVDVHYCYRCGRHASPQADKCLYCTASTRRVIRPARHCQFCDEAIGFKAVKCPHCGEFLDGRASEGAAAQPAPGPTTFVIEQAVIHTDPRAGLAGPASPLPEGRLPEPRQARGIEAPSREISDSPSLEGLPSPEPPADVPHEEIPVARIGAPPEHEAAAGGRPMNLIPVQSDLPAATPSEVFPASDRDEEAGRELIRKEPESPGRDLIRNKGGGEMIVREQSESSELPALLDVILAGFGAIRRRFAPLKDLEEAIDVKEEDEEARYRLCHVCDTEILADDHYCFHCGEKFSESPWRRPSKLKHVHKSNIALYAAILVSLIVHLLADTFLGEAQPGYVQPTIVATAILAPLIALWALARSSGIFRRLISLAFLFLSLAFIVLLGPLF